MKKLLALLLALSMMLTGVAALAEGEGDAPEATEEPVIEATPGDPDDYTYNAYESVFPTNWSVLMNETNTDSDIMDWIVDSFWNLDYNEDETGYAWHDAMAIGDPEDVTADYVGDEWGISAEETGRAWKVTLRDDLLWEDGTPINANSFVESLKRQLDPVALTKRADLTYSGSMVIHNAENYAKQGRPGQPSPASLTQVAEIEGLADVAAVLEAHGDEPGYIDWNNSFGDTYDFEAKAWTGAADAGTVKTPLTLSELYAFYTTGEGAAYATWASAEDMLEWANDELFVAIVRPIVDFETVGMKAVSDNELVFILDKPLTPGFQVKYNLSAYLVHTELYDSLAKEENDVYSNAYGTSTETTKSYGPYKLTFFQSDREFILEKNENWYGYKLADNEGKYQTTRIDYVYIANPETAMEMFLAGKLDGKGLDVNYIEEYRSSEYAYESNTLSIFAIALNPDEKALQMNQQAAGENINKTILTVKEFREALSLGLDRSSFVAATSPANAPAFALYGDLHIADPETGAYYRDSVYAKEAIANFWGLSDEIGEGKLYPTIDDAVDSITGYNPEMAKEYFNAAYDIAIEKGLMDEDDVVEIIIGLPSATSPFYNNGYEFIVNNYTELVKGTKLEGKLTFKRDDTVGNNFGTALRNNQVDMLFGVGFSGSAFDPYGFMEVFTVNENLRYDTAWDQTQEMLTVELDGVNYTASLIDWYGIINGTTTQVTLDDGTTAELSLPYALDEHDAENRTKALAAMENRILQNYTFIPLMNNASISLKGQQINYHTEEFLYPMGYGGLAWYTYNYTDGEWDEYVASQGGILNYK